MNRLRLLLVLMAAGLWVSSPAVAQTTIAAVQGGATLSDFTSTGSGFFSNTRWGGTAGLLAGRTFGRNAQVNFEVNWVQKGGGDVRVDYVEVPLTVGGGLVAARGWNVRGYAGIGVGFKTSCKDSTAGVSLDACTGVKDTEWTVPFGILFGKWTDSGKFFGIDTRFSFGLSDVFDNLSVKNRSLQLRAIIGTKVGR